MLPKCRPHNYTHFVDCDRFLRSFMHEMIHSMATPFGILRKGTRISPLSDNLVASIRFEHDICRRNN